MNHYDRMRTLRLFGTALIEEHPWHPQGQYRSAGRASQALINVLNAPTAALALGAFYKFYGLYVTAQTQTGRDHRL
jgi:hypothetical protein